MQNQMDNLIEGSQHQYDEYCKQTDKAISDYINENGYTWTVEDIYKQWENYCKGDYISHTAIKVIEKFKDELAKITGIKLKSWKQKN